MQFSCRINRQPYLQLSVQLGRAAVTRSVDIISQLVPFPGVRNELTMHIWSLESILERYCQTKYEIFVFHTLLKAGEEGCG
jgi:hypothetical protein